MQAHFPRTGVEHALILLAETVHRLHVGDVGGLLGQPVLKHAQRLQCGTPCLGGLGFEARVILQHGLLLLGRGIARLHGFGVAFAVHPQRRIHDGLAVGKIAHGCLGVAVAPIRRAGIAQQFNGLLTLRALLRHAHGAAFDQAFVAQFTRQRINRLGVGFIFHCLIGIGARQTIHLGLLKRLGELAIHTLHGVRGAFLRGFRLGLHLGGFRLRPLLQPGVITACVLRHDLVDLAQFVSQPFAAGQAIERIVVRRAVQLHLRRLLLIQRLHTLVVKLLVQFDFLGLGVEHIGLGLQLLAFLLPLGETVLILVGQIGKHAHRLPVRAVHGHEVRAFVRHLEALLIALE